MENRPKPGELWVIEGRCKPHKREVAKLTRPGFQRKTWWSVAGAHRDYGRNEYRAVRRLYIDLQKDGD